MPSAVRRWFRLDERGATVRGEIVGGVTTFVTMAYIVIVNPAILAAAGIPVGPSTIATILVAALGTILMGLAANRPIAVAPYMGENAFLAFGLAALGIGWQLRLGAVFVSGAIFLVITLLGIRGWLANSISPSMKHAFAVGIGLFLSFIGLVETGIVKSFAVGKPPVAFFPPGTTFAPDAPVPPGGVAVPVEIGDLSSGPVLLAIAGVVLISVLLARRVRGALLVGIAAVAAVGIALGFAEPPRGVIGLPAFTGPDGLSQIAGALRFSETRADGTTVSLFSPALLPVLLTLFLMDFLDTVGTLVGLGAAGNMLDEKGNFPEVHRPMLVDATACMGSALCGTSTSGAYIESATGIRDGARTGLASLVTGGLFLLCLFFVPLAASLAALRFAYGPALVVVGVLMIPAVRNIAFDDLTELVPAFLTILVMVFTYNIANGLTAGLAVYPLFKLATGRLREINAGMAVLSALCLAYFAVGLVH